jgi:hypothetical protein
MLPLDHMVTIEREVVAHEDPAAEADADREPLVVRVPQADGVGVIAVLAAER